jgi:hypothetical protein
MPAPAPRAGEASGRGSRDGCAVAMRARWRWVAVWGWWGGVGGVARAPETMMARLGVAPVPSYGRPLRASLEGGVRASLALPWTGMTDRLWARWRWGRRGGARAVCAWHGSGGAATVQARPRRGLGRLDRATPGVGGSGGSGPDRGEAQARSSLPVDERLGEGLGVVRRRRRGGAGVPWAWRRRGDGEAVRRCTPTRGSATT